MFQLIHQYILSLLIFSPLVFCGLSLALKDLKAIRVLAVLGSFVTFLFSCHLWYYFDESLTGIQFVQHYQWISSFGISYFVGVDGINLLLVMLTTFLTPLVLISLFEKKEESTKNLIRLLLSLECGMLGALLALDLVFFYVFWEAMLIPMYFMIGLWGGKNRIYATTKFIIYTVFGSLFMLVAALLLYLQHYEQFGVYSSSLLDLYRVNFQNINTELLLFSAFALAFAIKVPIWPFHTWLPHAHTEAPTVGSVILAGVLLKMGTYGFVRFAIPLFPNAVELAAPFILGLGVFGIIYGALVAWVQPDAKKMIAYSSVSHLGYVVIGCLSFQNSSLNEEALLGAQYLMINHGISTGALFFLIGVIYERRHTRLFSEFGGLAKNMPWFAVMLIVATLGSVGLPGTGGFVGEFLVLLGSFQAKPIIAIVAALGVLLGALYMLTFCKSILFGPITKEENRSLKDLSFVEFLYITPLSLLVVFMGVCPEFFLKKMRTSVHHLSKTYHHYELLVPDQPFVSAVNKIEKRG